MRALLVHQGLEETLGDPRSEKKPNKLSEEEMQDALDKAHSTLILSLGDGVLREEWGIKQLLQASGRN